MSLKYQGAGIESFQNISAFDFDAFANTKSGLEGFCEWAEANTKEYLKELIRRLHESQPSKNYQAVKFSNPIMKKLIDYDWEEITRRVQIMVSPNDEFVIFMLYDEELKDGDSLIPIEEKS